VSCYVGGVVRKEGIAGWREVIEFKGTGPKACPAPAYVTSQASLSGAAARGLGGLGICRVHAAELQQKSGTTIGISVPNQMNKGLHPVIHTHQMDLRIKMRRP